MSIQTLKKQDSIKLPPINPNAPIIKKNSIKDSEQIIKDKNSIDISKPLRPFIYEEFLKMLTIDKINYFVELTKQKEIESKKRNMRLKNLNLFQL